MTTQDRASRIAKLEAELEQLRAERRYVETLTPEQRVAEELHSTFCRSNHTDGCGWEYESWTSPSWAKKKYLEHAKALLKVLGEAGIANQAGCVAVARRVVDALRNVR